jgi:thiamine-phosphate diphosphorylase
MLVTAPIGSDEALVQTVTAAVAGGVDLVQLRDKQASSGELFRLAERLREAIDGRARLVINGSWLGGGCLPADGIHLPENGPSVAEARSWLGQAMLVGRSVHSLAAAAAAEAEGADCVVAGTVFASPSHPETPPAGLGFVREICSYVSIPVIAIGGVTPENAADCLRAGASGVAVLSPLMRAADPRRVAGAYRSALDAVRPQGSPPRRRRQA